MPPPIRGTQRSGGQGARGRVAPPVPRPGRPFEEQPGTAQVQQPARETRPHQRDKTRQDVLWADEGKSLDDYTFYRESTPPPPVTRISTEDSKKTRSRSGTGSGFKRRLAAPTICGLRRRLFCIVLAVAALVVVLGVGLGVGLGLSMGDKTKSDDGDSSSPAKSGAASGAASPSPTLSSTPSAASSTSSSTSSSDRIETTPIVSCPAANDTEYNVPQSGKTFLRICGIDYSGINQAVDLGNVLTSSMQDCMINCAGYPGCTGCGWGIIPGDATSEHRCWLKGKLQEHHMTRSGWEFAILQ